MYNYVPFLKLKVNEVGAINVLDDKLKEVIVPFFDLPKQKDGATPADFFKMTSKAARSAAKNLKGIKAFFLDNFDIDDTIKIGGIDNYAFVIEKFKDLEFIPVVGLDRTDERNNIVFQKKKDGIIKSNTLGIRLLNEDFVSYELVEDDIANIISASNGYFGSLVFVLDNRVCIDADISAIAGKISKFVTRLNQDFQPDSIVITGSSIPASIADILAVESDGIYKRKEVEIYRTVASHVQAKNMALGDYTIVSPLYSEFKIPPQAMRNVTAPKIFYAYDDLHYVIRGGALKTHARGDLQYNDLAAELISKPFYRNPAYSFGDNFLSQKANFVGSNVTPSSILKPTINAHITYMLKNFSI